MSAAGSGVLGVASGVVVVDKPAGWTSHDVVGRIRRLAGTRRVGHAGTLDPMATGVLLVGVERATRLLGHLSLTDKAYSATIRLGQATDTDDADGSVIATVSAAAVDADAIEAALATQRGEIDQVPAAVSAIKVAGKRSYARVRAGEDVTLTPRRVTISRLDVLAIRPGAADDPPGVVDVDVVVECSTGTYVRAIARDIGAALGVGGHLTALRRTRVGPFDLSVARTLDELAADFVVEPLVDVATRVFPRRDLSAEEAYDLVCGRRIPATGSGDAVVAALGPGGDLVALLRDADPSTARSLVVFAHA